MKLFFVLLCVFLAVEGASKSKNSFKSRSKRDKTVLSPASFESERFTYSYEKVESPNSEEGITGQLKTYMTIGIPRAQFMSFFGVSIPIILVGSYWDNDDAISQIVKALSVYSIYLCVLRFFGFQLILLDGSVRFKKLNFHPTDKFVTFKRWAMTPIFWICQILVSTSKDTYNMLMNDYGFPSYNTFLIIGIFSGFFTLGVFELIENFTYHFHSLIIKLTLRFFISKAASAE